MIGYERLRLLRQHPAHRVEAIKWDLFVLLIFVLLSALFTYPLITCLSTCAHNSGDPLLNAWILAWDAHKLQTGLVGFFDANIYYPHPRTLAFSEAQIANGLLALPILAILNRPLLAHNLLMLFAYAISGYGTYCLVHHFTGNRWASFAAGLVFAFCPFRLAHSQLQIVSTAWMPLTFLYLDKAVRQPNGWHFAGLVLFYNLQALSSYYHAIYLAMGVAVLVVLYLALVVQSRDRLRVLGGLAATGIFTLALNLPLAAPYFELSQMGFVRDVETTRLFQTTWRDFLTVTPENLLYGDLTVGLRGPHWSEHVTFPGAIAVAFATLSILYLLRQLLRRIRRQGEPRGRALPLLILFYAVLACVAIVLAMGDSVVLPWSEVRLPLPFGWLFTHVPGFKALRVPSRFNILTMQAIAVLVGYGYHVARTLLARLTSSNRLTSLLSVVVIALMGLEYVAFPIHYTAHVPNDIPEVYAWLAQQDDETIILELPFPTTPAGEPDWDAYPGVEGWRVYYSAFHWKRTVNGYSGFLPIGYDQLVRTFTAFPDGASISRALELDIDYILVHLSMFQQDARGTLRQRISEHGDVLQLVGLFGDVLVVEVMD